MVLGLLTGVLGSLHCVGMCSPLLMSLPFKSWQGILTYHLGRILVYAIWGGFLGFFGQMAYMGGLQQSLSIILGVLMIILVIFPNTFYFFKNNWSKYLIKTRQFMLPKLKKNIYIHWFTLGVFNGLLPCGLVYVAAIGATIMGTFWEGALYMGLFGLGTLPITLLLSAHQTWLTPKLKIRFLKFVPILLFIAGVLLILRGLNLGIPYVSPIVENGTIHCVNCE